MTYVEQVCKTAAKNKNVIARLSEEKVNRALSLAAEALIKNSAYIINENKRDILSALGKPSGFIDRLTINEERIRGIAEGLTKLIALPSPVGEEIETFTARAGFVLHKVRVPLGVIGIIYEARPNVTADAIGLALKSGNAVVLRGSKDALSSNRAITSVIKDAVTTAVGSADFIQLIEDGERASSEEFLKQDKYIDLMIPRGGAGLIRYAKENAKMPFIETGAGNCHAYVDKCADFDMAVSVIINAKTSRVSVCNSLESLLVDRTIAPAFLPKICAALQEKGVEVRGSAECKQIVPEIVLATNDDYYAEYDDYIISVALVENVSEAVDWINEHSTHHSEVIITEDERAASVFLTGVDSCAVYHNISTRFTDGFEFGLGAEMGISTQKLHARGPMGLKELTTYKYIASGKGEIRK